MWHALQDVMAATARVPQCWAELIRFDAIPDLVVGDNKRKGTIIRDLVTEKI
jgi:hypothetical protein